MEPRFSESEGTEEEFQKLIFDQNLEAGRHLNESQRAMIAAGMANVRKGQNYLAA